MDDAPPGGPLGRKGGDLQGGKGGALPEIAVGVDDPSPRRLHPFLLELHRFVAAEHAKGELVDGGLEQRAELPPLGLRPGPGAGSRTRGRGGCGRGRWRGRRASRGCRLQSGGRPVARARGDRPLLCLHGACGLTRGASRTPPRPSGTPGDPTRSRSRSRRSPAAGWERRRRRLELPARRAGRRGCVQAGCTAPPGEARAQTEGREGVAGAWRGRGCEPGGHGKRAGGPGWGVAWAWPHGNHSANPGGVWPEAGLPRSQSADPEGAWLAGQACRGGAWPAGANTGGSWKAGEGRGVGVAAREQTSQPGRSVARGAGLGFPGANQPTTGGVASWAGTRSLGGVS